MDFQSESTRLSAQVVYHFSNVARAAGEEDEDDAETIFGGNSADELQKQLLEKQLLVQGLLWLGRGIVVVCFFPRHP